MGVGVRRVRKEGVSVFNAHLAVYMSQFVGTRMMGIKRLYCGRIHRPAVGLEARQVWNKFSARDAHLEATRNFEGTRTV